ncbi:MAG: 4-alpha-glucanotransferase [Spirochaetaceae bacterium]|nr:4-alpha-glucanotransferase [Spirochaetaceae bacterium]
MIATKSSIPTLTGTAIPLGSLKTKKSCGVGEYPDLIPFAAFCKKAGLSLIQLLPVNDTGTESSPYSALSAFALHPLYISIESLQEYKTVSSATKKMVKKLHETHDSCERFNYSLLRNEKLTILRQIFEENISSILDSLKNSKSDMSLWVSENLWVKEYAVFLELKRKFNEASWKEWPAEFRRLTCEQIENRWNDESLWEAHAFFVWVQFCAFSQFRSASLAIAEKGLILKGDIPIMMNEDSADAWAHPEFFDDTMRAGSPPDGFNPAGQNWGFPIYKWEELEKVDYSWWKQRLIVANQFYGAYRIDHVLGFFRIWATSARESTAMLGRTQPGIVITRKQLNELGFDNDRIRWLSQSHVPTRVIEEVNNNDYLGTHGILQKIMDRVGEEELWLFKKEVKGDKDIYEREDIPEPVKNKLAECWRDKTLISLSEDEFVPLWTYRDTTAWNSLSWEEKEKLEKLFKENNEKQEELWEKQARKLLGELTSTTDMIACAEDLGANPESVPRVLKDLSVLRLCVVRWYREWEKEGQPFINFADYPENSVVTSSVHDSSTLRLWWLSEKDAADFYRDFPPAEGMEDFIKPDIYTPDTAKYLLEYFAKAASKFCIHPLQDFLALKSCYYKEDPQMERVNIPGSVNEFNWTYRLPVQIEELSSDKELISAISDIAKQHKKSVSKKK